MVAPAVKGWYYEHSSLNSSSELPSSAPRFATQPHSTPLTAPPVLHMPSFLLPSLSYGNVASTNQATVSTEHTRPLSAEERARLAKQQRAQAAKRAVNAGIIIAASVLVAAGIAVYENPQVRQWVDGGRRKIAIALHSLGNEIQPPNEEELKRKERRRQREEIARRKRNDLIRRAREEGVAVDLDELARIGREVEEGSRPTTPTSSHSHNEKRPRRGKSFDDLVTDDGMLRTDNTTEFDEKHATSSTAVDPTADNGLRQRGAGARGFDSGSAFAAGFADDDFQPLIDVSEEPQPAQSQAASRESTTTLNHEAVENTVLLQAPTAVEDPAISVPELPTNPFEPTHENLADSYYSSAHEDAHEDAHSELSYSVHSFVSDQDDTYEQAHSTGTLTPTDAGSNPPSHVGLNAEDIAVLDDMTPAQSQAGDHDDIRSEVFSETSFSDIGGINTPGSWTDVGSDYGSEDGRLAQHGGQSIIHQ